MEEPKPKNKPAPGIAEALHPEIGNGSALETDKHSFILRIPDPSLQITEHLVLSEEEVLEALKEDKAEEGADSPETHISEEHALAEPLDQPIETFSGQKVSKKKKTGKGSTASDSEKSETTGVEFQEGKRQKAGKLLRKAAKSIKKQEEELKIAEEEKSERPGLALSPFTSWLKKLSGSDYVHPYEDDFAFEQASGSGKEGISETYADLLAAQGYKDQAREMYIKLMEKYPEKSGFFAAKLEALQ